jgi:hypothetical protein
MNLNVENTVWRRKQSHEKNKKVLNLNVSVLLK